jgi:hypothetical protein
MREPRMRGRSDAVSVSGIYLDWKMVTAMRLKRILLQRWIQ